MVIVHGITEHKGRYLQLQEDLAKAAYCTYSYDQRGFGLSGGARTDIADYRHYLYDLKAVIAEVRAAALPDRKVVLLGHSLGGAVAATFCIDYPDAVDALVLSSPAYDVPTLAFPLEQLAALLKFVIPTVVMPYPSTRGKRSRDPSVDLAVSSDPLIVNKATPRFYVEFRKMNRCFRENAEQIILPTLILQGGQDKIVRPEGAQDLFACLTHPKKELITYEDYYHEVFNEIGREKVVADLVSWLDELCNSDG